MDDPFERTAFASAIFYKDPMTALRWLEAAFGFEVAMLITDAEGNLGHSEMTYPPGGAGHIMVGGEWMDALRSPVSIGGKCSQSIHVRVPADIDAHCERARAAGAVILMEPQDQFYGDRTYRCADLEGHHWTFGQPVRQVSRAQAETASGLKIEARDWA